MIFTVSTILFVFSFLSVGISASLFYFHKMVQRRQLGVIFLCSAAASFAYGMEIFSPALADKFAWVVVRYFALTIFILVYSLFVFYYTKIPISFVSWKFLGLCLIPATALFFLATYPLTHLVYDQIWLDSSGPIPMIKRTMGPLYWVLNIYALGLLLALIYLILRRTAQVSKLDKIHSAIIAAGIILHVATHLLHLAGVSIFGVLNPNIFSYFPAALLTLWGIQRFRLADIRPIARNLIFDQMQESILVVDHLGNLIDINPAAERCLKTVNLECLGKPLSDITVELADVLANSGKQEQFESYIVLHKTPLQVDINELKDRSGEDAGYLLILRDISNQVEAERLKEADTMRKSAWEERMKLARTLHDSALQNIGSLIILAGSARQRLDEQLPNEIAPLVGHLETGARLAYQDLRLLIDELQLNSAAETEFDLLKTLAAKIDALKSQGSSDIVFEAPTNLLLDAGRQREVFYIILEALNNALKHADAKIVRIRIWQSEGEIVGEIEDDGNGFDPRQKRNTGMGMQNMQSRARLMGGQLAVISAPGEGTRVRLEISVS